MKKIVWFEFSPMRVGCWDCFQTFNHILRFIVKIGLYFCVVKVMIDMVLEIFIG